MYAVHALSGCRAQSPELDESVHCSSKASLDVCFSARDSWATRSTARHELPAFMVQADRHWQQGVLQSQSLKSQQGEN